MLMSERRTPIAIAGTVAAAALLGSPASARATHLATDMPCYGERQPGTALLTGFTPNAGVMVKGGGVVASGVTDAAGSLALPFAAPPRGTTRPGSTRIVLTATEVAGPAPQPAAKAAFRVTTLSFASRGPRAPKAMRTWTFSGFRPGEPIYGHFRFKGRTRANHRFGVATAPCGELRRRAPAFPVRGRVEVGTWRIQVDQRRFYSAATVPRLATTTIVFRRAAPRAIQIG